MFKLKHIYLNDLLQFALNFNTNCVSFFITNCVESLLQITSAILLQIASILLQIASDITICVDFITNCVRYYKVCRLLQITSVQRTMNTLYLFFIRTSKICLSLSVLKFLNF